MNGKEIISFDEWKKVQDIMTKKKRNPPKAKYRWLPFSGLLYDGYTGSKLVVSKNRTQIIYFPNITNLKANVKTGGVVLFQADKKDYSGIYEAINPILLLVFRHKVKIDNGKIKVQIDHRDINRSGITRSIRNEE